MLGVLYSALAGVWALIFVMVVINLVSYRRQVTRMHCFMLFTVILKLVACSSICSAMFYNEILLNLLACSGFALFSTAELTLYILISQGHSIFHTLSDKENLATILQMIISCICYNSYLLFKHGSIPLILLLLHSHIFVLKKASSNIRKLKTIMSMLNHEGMASMICAQIHKIQCIYIYCTPCGYCRCFRPFGVSEQFELVFGVEYI